jgi:hypothetical protein
MRTRTTIALYVVAMVTVVVVVDLLFFTHRFRDRLIVNIGIVVVFVAVYLRFLRRHETCGHPSLAAVRSFSTERPAGK